MDAKLCHLVRQHLAQGNTITVTEEKLARQGYAKRDIALAVKEFYKDQATTYDDKLVTIIEKRFRKGDFMQDIMEKLNQEGHTPFEIEKAVLRASTRKDSEIDAVFKGWELYSMIHLIILVLTLVLSIFYTPAFLVMTFIILILLFASSANIPVDTRKWKTEIAVLPLSGLTITQGFFGYNSVIGNYFRWWFFDPALILFFLLIFFGIYFSLYYGVTMLIISFCLAGLALGIFFTPRKQSVLSPKGF